MSVTTRLTLLITGLLSIVAVLFYGASRISSQFFVPSTCKGDRASNRVAVTFDDGPHPDRTREIMEILERFNCKASFFFTGAQVAGNENVVKALAATGHSIGNHSFSHSGMFPLFRGKTISGEIRETNLILEGITGNPVKYFRPPFGVTNPNIWRGLQGTNLRVVGWSIRSFDTRNEEAEKVIRRITRKLRGGDIILLHETSDHILQVLEQLLAVMDRRGLKCVSLDRMLENDPG
jgi:peptidoglycan/xylan/chitin deacetylase (PgdA/CDA1 family)